MAYATEGVFYLFVFTLFILFLALIDWLKEQSTRREELQRVFHQWPTWTTPFWRLIVLLRPLTTRIRASSPLIRRRLLLLGMHPNFDDEALFRLRFSAGVLAFIVSCLLVFVFQIFIGRLSGTLSLDNVSSLLVACMSIGILAAGLTYVLSGTWLRDRALIVERSIRGCFPNFLDVLALALESGKNFQSALQMSLAQMSESGSSSWLRYHLRGLMVDIRSGESQGVALQRLSTRLSLPEFIQFVATVLTAERQGASVALILRRQASQLRVLRALDAERQAAKAPVKLLAPLAICIFPCTFAILMFPIGVQLKSSGLFT